MKDAIRKMVWFVIGLYAVATIRETEGGAE